MKKRTLVSLVMVISLLVWGGGISYAKVAGVCGNCHTMHNSQGGTNMMINTTIDGTGGTDGGSYNSLTRGTCVGCHTGTNVSGGSTPFVYNTAAVTYGTDTLAGGNFKWVVADDAKGHNVKGIPGMSADAVLTIAPGDSGTTCAGTSCHGTLFAPDASSLGLGGGALDTGCEGCHVDPKHHAPQQAAGAIAGQANGYFRFLSNHYVTGDTGVHGIEDDDWQLSVGSADHNEYLGDAAGATNTMTGYCIGCHGKFHDQVSTVNGDWIRHPSDAVLPNTGEYTAYTAYDPNVPVARPDLANIADTSLVANNADMVMCLSCHRAHGSPYDDLLRWDYDDMVAGDASKTGGCFVCHTSKNGSTP